MLHTASPFSIIPHVVGKKAQVLGNDGLFAQGLFHGAEQIHARALAPPSAAGVGLAVGDGIVPRKAPEMVDAQYIVGAAQHPEPPHPPGIAVPGHGVPVVQGVAPQLAGGGKSIRRAAGYLGGQQVLVQLEGFRCAPDDKYILSYMSGSAFLECPEYLDNYLP